MSRSPSRPSGSASASASETSPLLHSTHAVTDNGTLKVLPSDPIPEDAGRNAVIDEEATEGAPLKNPLEEGMPDVRRKMWMLLPAVGIGIYLGALDQTIIVSTYATIGNELHALNSTSWIATAYFLTLTTFQPLYGKLSDIFGRKPLLLTAYTIFGLGSLLCGLARTMPELIAARAFAGVGGGGMNVVTSILMSDIIPLRERGKWQGYVNIIYATGAASGAPLGGLLADSIGWRWAFLAQAPMCAAAFLAVYMILDLPKASHSHWVSRVKRVDFPGAMLLITATSFLLVGLDIGSNKSWTLPVTLGLLISAAPLYLVFMYIEHTASHPFAPSHIIFARSLWPPFIANFFAFAGYMAMIFYIPLYFQAVTGMSSTGAGVRLIPAIVGSVTGSVGGGLLMQKTGRYYWLTLSAYTVMFLGQVGIMLCSGVLVSSVTGIVAALTFSAVGGGIGVTTTLIALISNADPKDQAIVTACSYLFRSLGSAVGVSLAATVVQSRLRKLLQARLGGTEDTERIVQGVRESLEYLEKLTPEVRRVVVECYERGVMSAFVFSSCILVGAILAACFLREKKL